MNCPNCGAPVAPGILYCTQCHAAVNGDGAAGRQWLQPSAQLSPAGGHADYTAAGMAPASGLAAPGGLSQSNRGVTAQSGLGTANPMQQSSFGSTAQPAQSNYNSGFGSGYGSGFGSTAQPAQTSYGSGFGSTAQPAQSNYNSGFGSGYGSTAQPAQTSYGSGFDNTAQPAQSNYNSGFGSSYGSTANPAQTGYGSGFGNTASPAHSNYNSGFGSSYGSTAQPVQSNFGSGYGSTANPAQSGYGSTAQPVQSNYGSSYGSTANPAQTGYGSTAQPVQSNYGSGYSGTANPAQTGYGSTAQPVQSNYGSNYGNGYQTATGLYGATTYGHSSEAEEASHPNPVVARLTELPRTLLGSLTAPGEVLRSLVLRTDVITGPIVLAVTLVVVFLGGMAAMRGVVGVLFNFISSLTGISLAGSASALRQGVNYIAGQVAPAVGGIAVLCQLIAIVVPVSVVLIYLHIAHQMPLNWLMALDMASVATMPTVAVALIATLCSMINPLLALLVILLGIVVAYLQLGHMMGTLLGGTDVAQLRAKLICFPIAILLTLALIWLLGGTLMGNVFQHMISLMGNMGGTL